MKPPRDDAGTASVEFIVLAVLLLIPLAYVVMSVMTVQAASFATTHAAREAGRAFVTADSAREASLRAQAAAELAFADQGFAFPARSMSITCPGVPCLEPGSQAVVTIDWQVPLPWMPAFVESEMALPIHAVHQVPVDAYRLTL